MSIEIKVPPLPESVADATVAAWHKKPGEQVKRDENLVDLETDKVVLEVPSPVDGVLSNIICDVGSTVTADQMLAVITSGAVQAVAASVEPMSPPTVPPNSGMPAAASPSVRRYANENQVPLAQVSGSGDKGRVLKSDVDAHRQPATAVMATELPARPVERVPMSRLRARVAQRLLDSQHQAAILTTFNEVDLGVINQLRRQYRDQFEKKHGVRLGFMSFFTKAVVEALKRFPVVNASIDGSDIVYHGFYDIGIAVSTERGLVVPVLRDAEQLGLADIEKAVRDFGTRAKEGKLQMEEMQGGTFTITNGGVFGSLLSTPIINPPQTAILGMHKIQDRPVVIDGEIHVRPMMYVALSYDHRLIDGKDSVQFLATIKSLLEDPQRLLLDI